MTDKVGENWSCLEKTRLNFSSNVSFIVVIARADLFQKLPLYECPLLLRLIAGPDLERLSFVLKENETGEVEVRGHFLEKCKMQNECLSKLTSWFFSPNNSSFPLFPRQWHAFSIPELQNFLVILEKEEAERVRAVEQKYSIYRQKLQLALRQHDP